MRVVFDHQIFAFQKYGGISRYFVRLVESMLKHPGTTPRIIAPLHVNAYLAGLPHGVVSGLAMPFSDFNQKLARNVSQRVIRPLVARERPDIVHETYFAAQGSAPRGARTVLTVYDMIHERFADAFPAGDKTAALKRAAVLRADHVLCISESTRRDLIAEIPEAEGKASVTLLGFDSFGTGPGGDAGSGRKPFLLYVGERQRYKNFNGLLRAWAGSAKLRGAFDIRCFGGGPPTDLERALISELKVDAGAIHFESGADAALAASYRDAAAFVYPSLYEGFGIPPLEAMSTSCPVIASDRSSIPEVCGDAAAYFDPDDIESIRDVIEHTVLDSAKCDALIARGHERLKQFSWDRCAASTIAAYGALL